MVSGYTNLNIKTLWPNRRHRSTMVTTTVHQFVFSTFFFSLQVLQENVALTCVGIHDSVVLATHRFWQEVRRHYYVTPSSYMELIRTYSKLLDEKRSTFVNNRSVNQLTFSSIFFKNSWILFLHHSMNMCLGISSKIFCRRQKLLK